MRAYAPSVIVAGLGTAMLAAMLLVPTPGAPALIVFAPGTAPDRAVAAVAAAGWRPIASARANIVVAAPESVATSKPDGALLLLNALGLQACR